MKRRLLNLLTVVSLLLCVAVVALWVRGYSSRDTFTLTWPSGRAIIESTPGHIVFGLSLGGNWEDELGIAFWRCPPEPEANEPLLSIVGSGPARYTMWEHWGFGYLWASAAADNNDRTWRLALVPSWALAFILAVLPVASFGRWRRARTRCGGNLCPRCGYDLRATPDRCPECGVEPRGATT
jgi:hypothetical protein